MRTAAACPIGAIMALLGRYRLRPKPLGRLGAGFCRHFLAVARWLCGLKDDKQFVRCIGNGPHRVVEGFLVAHGGLVGATDLAHELQRRFVNFGIRRRRFEVEERLDVPTHGYLP